MTHNNGTYHSKSTVIILTIALSSLQYATPFTFKVNSLSFVNNSISQSTITRPKFFSLFGESDDGDQEKGNEANSGLFISQKLDEALGSLGANGGYLDAAKKRNEEAKKKLLEETRREEEQAEAWRKERAERAEGEGDFGPKDMNEFKGFLDDGYEKSVGNDDVGGWDSDYVSQNKEKEEEAEDEPKLFLFGDDDSEEKSLIL